MDFDRQDLQHHQSHRSQLYFDHLNRLRPQKRFDKCCFLVLVAIPPLFISFNLDLIRAN
jgi:hypothetical protein